jgi:hypothetical protein
VWVLPVKASGADKGLPPLVHFAFAFLFGLPVLALNWLPQWSLGAAGFIYLLLAISATGLLVILILALGAAQLILQARGRRNESVVKLLRMLPLWLLAFVVAFLLTRVTRPELPVGSDIDAFDAVRWQADKITDSEIGALTPRQRMLKGAVAAARNANSRREIEASLGPTLDTAYFRDSGRDLIYILGPERGVFSMDNEWLLIWLDANGKMARFQIATD